MKKTATTSLWNEKFRENNELLVPKAGKLLAMHKYDVKQFIVTNGFVYNCVLPKTDDHI